MDGDHSGLDEVVLLEVELDDVEALNDRDFLPFVGQQCPHLAV